MPCDAIEVVPYAWDAHQCRGIARGKAFLQVAVHQAGGVGRLLRGAAVSAGAHQCNQSMSQGHPDPIAEWQGVCRTYLSAKFWDRASHDPPSPAALANTTRPLLGTRQASSTNSRSRLPADQPRLFGRCIAQPAAGAADPEPAFMFFGSAWPRCDGIAPTDVAAAFA